MKPRGLKMYQPLLISHIEFGVNLRSDLKRLENHKWLNARQLSYELIAEYMGASFTRFEFNQIIETGTARTKNNWSGDGQSTLIWDFLASRFPHAVSVVSIDINEEAVETAMAQVSDRVSFICGDSIHALKNLPDEIVNKTGLLYLDSFDWSPELNEASSQHHLNELMAVYKRLPGGCLIVVDDCHTPWQGKHIKVKHFFDSLGVVPLIQGYQMAWIKPL